MVDEIKEILDKLKLLCYDDYCLEFSVDYIERKEEKLLLDYITNLQEENKQLKELKYKFFDCSGDEESFTLEDYLELGNNLYDLQEENEKLKNKCEILEENNSLLIGQKHSLYCDLDTLSSRNDRAIYWIDEYCIKECEEGDIKVELRYVKDILKGEGNE